MASHGNHHGSHQSVPLKEADDLQDLHSSHSSHIYTFAVKSSAAFLFSPWTMESIPGLLAALVVSALLSICLEAMKNYNNYLTFKLRLKNRCHGDWCGPFSTKVHVVQTIIHVSQVASGYILMLCVMTYNIWILAAVATGAGVGHFLIRPIAFTYHEHLIEGRRECQGKRKSKESNALLNGNGTTNGTNANGNGTTANGHIPTEKSVISVTMIESVL